MSTHGGPPPRRRPLEGPDGAARARAARRRRAPLRGRRARAARPLRRTRRSTSCSSGRTTSPSTCRTASSTRDHRREPRRRGAGRTSSSSPSSASRAARSRRRCRTAAPQQALADLAGLRVATAYPVSTRAALAEAGVEAELVTISGSVEAAPRLGLSDAVVDLVSTGSTASANGLRRIGRLLSSEAVLIANRTALDDGRRELRRTARADAARRRRGAAAAAT